MSEHLENNEGDLIDLHVGSPVLPRTQPSSPQPIHEDDYDNLLDSELPVLERKLQTAPALISSNHNSRRGSVDVEDILISIDDEEEEEGGEYECDGPLHRLGDPLRRSNSEVILNSRALRDWDRSLSCDDLENLEVLNVLHSLDEVLNASLVESNRALNRTEGNGPDSHMRQDSIEACLMDLDNYLQAALEGGGSSSDENSDYGVGDINEIISDASTENIGSSDGSLEEGLRSRLRRIEQNYAKFVASGYADQKCRGFEGCKHERSLSLRSAECGEHRELRRGHPCRVTVLGLRESNRFGKSLENCSRGPDPTSATAGESDEDIDWSWVQDVARDVTLERRAHASGDCCTGTIVVEPLQRVPTDPSGSSAAATVMATAEGAVTMAKAAPAATWVRTSMRRLRHFRLPSDAEEAPPPLPPTVVVMVEDSVPVYAAAEELPAVRPLSAPSRLSHSVPSARTSQRSRPRSRESVSHAPGGRARSSSASSRSRRPRSLSSSVSSLASTVDSSPSCTPAPTPTHNDNEQQTNSQRRSCERSRQSDMPESESPLGQWPHSLSSMMACLGCTLGLFNISRFAVLTIHFGANFIFQFFFLSMVFGLPLFTLQLCLGQQLGAGVIDMWRISPLFQGVGVSLLIAQALMGLYSIIGVSWMFVFFRDSFITKVDKYRWAEPFLHYRHNVQVLYNDTYDLSQTVPDYFSGIVLQRYHLTSPNTYGTIKFQLAFNLAVVWMIVFVSLSKGLRSYGKVIYVFTLLPVFGTFILCAKVLGMMPPEYINIVFPETTWNEFFINSKSWLAAAQETFLTWGLLGAAVMQIASHNKNKHLLQRDSSLIAVITFTILLLTAFLANTCVQILRSYGYSYVPGSFERMSSYSFMRSVKDPLPPNLSNTPIKYMVHNSFIIGEKVVRPGVDYTRESGYQALRLATELIPATFAILGPDQVSPFWAVLFYFILILFGIAQQLAIWHCVITGIMAIKAKVLKSWETTITLFSCACGFVLGLPMATEFGIYVVYFMDYTVGGLWWLILVIVLQIAAVFMVRGRPYSGDTVVTALFTSNNHPCILSWAPALLSFTWNVILPVALMVLCITTFKNGSFRDMFIWHHAPVAEYWSLWTRQIGSMLQLCPILLIPLVAVIQSYRYLSSGPSDILDRIQLLYRPPIGEHMTDLAVHDAAAASLNNNVSTTVTSASTVEDPPPKYTPPPSYTTATGARIAKFLRQSIRRSVRRLANVLGESSNSRQRGGMSLQPPPPDYNAVLVEMNQSSSNTTDLSIISIPDSAVPIRISTLERLRTVQPIPGSPTLTAAEVASILRSSFRRSTVRPSRSAVRSNNLSEDNTTSLSAENLVDSAAPIGQTSLVMEHLSHSEAGIKCDTSNSSVI